MIDALARWRDENLKKKTYYLYLKYKNINFFCDFGRMRSAYK